MILFFPFISDYDLYENKVICSEMCFNAIIQHLGLWPVRCLVTLEGAGWFCLHLYSTKKYQEVS